MFRDELSSELTSKRFVDHAIEIEKNSKPQHRPLFQLSPAELKVAKEYVESLLKAARIRPSKSAYDAPLFFVKEKDRLRGVVNYRGLNRITKRNNTPIPRSDEIFDRISGARVFSRLRLKTGFHQVRVKPKDVKKTAFNIEYGPFEYMVMPVGLWDSPATFQMLMGCIFHCVINGFMYICNLLIFIENEESHYCHLRRFLERLQENDLYVSLKKCDPAQDEISFFRMKVGATVIQVNPEKVEILRTWPKPTSVTDLRSFSGTSSVFSKVHLEFLEDCSTIDKPHEEQFRGCELG